jgi:hypothetical protein
MAQRVSWSTRTAGVMGWTFVCRSFSVFITFSGVDLNLMTVTPTSRLAHMIKAQTH